MKLFVTLVSTGLCLAAPVFAFDDADRKAVETVFETLSTGIESANYEQVFSVLPDAMLAKMAEPTGMDAAAFKAVAIEQMKAAMSQVAIKEFGYDIAGMETATTDAGRDYAIVSTDTVMDMGGQTIKATGPALAFEDQGAWYVLQVQSPDQTAMLGELYPDLANVQLPAPTIAPVQ